jgi:ParB-like chromosome segregation protein Spo0J
VEQKNLKIKHTAAALDTEVQKAAKELRRPETGDGLTVTVGAQDVATRPEPFQPRIFGQGLQQVDEANVHKLTRLISIRGELDPITVVRLGERWTCVDGHHRLEAYRRLKWKDPIKATWFTGDIREALDHALLSGEVVKLDIADRDRYEAAWQRVVLGWGSKRDIARITVVSERLVGNMRAVKTKYDKGDAFSKQFRAALGADLKDVTWRRAKMAHDGVEPGKFDKHEAAAKLAKEIGRRFHHKLAEDPEVTAIALALYDRHLPQPLAWELHKFTKPVQMLEADYDDGGVRIVATEVPTYPRATLAHMTDQELREAVERIDSTRLALLKQQREAEAEQDRRNAGGTRSDDTWNQWVLDAPDPETDSPEQG